MSEKITGAKVARPQTRAEALAHKLNIRMEQDIEQMREMEQEVVRHQKGLNEALTVIRMRDEDIEKLEWEIESEKKVCERLAFDCVKLEKRLKTLRQELKALKQELKTLREENKPLNTWADEI